MLHKKVRVKERTPNAPRIIFVVGGYYKVSLTSLIAFNVDTGCWNTLAKLNIARSGLGAVFIKVNSTFFLVLIFFKNYYFTLRIHL